MIGQERAAEEMGVVVYRDFLAALVSLVLCWGVDGWVDLVLWTYKNGWRVEDICS